MAQPELPELRLLRFCLLILQTLLPLAYDFDIQVRTAAAEVYTVLKGKFDLEYDVSRASTAGA